MGVTVLYVCGGRILCTCEALRPGMGLAWKVAGLSAVHLGWAAPLICAYVCVSQWTTI